MKDIRNKIVVITGAGSGIGRALAIEYGKLGAKVALNDFNEQGLADTINILNKMGISNVISAVFDVSSKKSMDAFAELVKSKWGNAHIVINNAGIAGGDLPAYLLSEEAYRRIMEVNFFGVLNGCKSFLPHLVENNEGAIANVSSIFGLVGTANNSDYCASKFAVRGYTETLATEFEESPITIHCIHPGGIRTNIAGNANTLAFEEKYLKTPPEAIARYIIKAIQRKKVKIVYGHGALRVWFISNFVPQRLTNWFVWREAKSIIDISKYKRFIKSL